MAEDLESAQRLATKKAGDWEAERALSAAM
jgi:hypothetical protein